MRRPLIGGKDFQPSIGQGIKLKEGSWRWTKGKWYLMCVFFGGERGECVCENFLVSMCGKVLFTGKKCVQTKTMKGSYV
jgi:hypothetical protein